MARRMFPYRTPFIILGQASKRYAVLYLPQPQTCKRGNDTSPWLCDTIVYNIKGMTVARRIKGEYDWLADVYDCMADVYARRQITVYNV